MDKEQFEKLGAAIESKTAGRLYVDFELDKPQDRERWYDLTPPRDPLRWFAFVLPQDVPSLLPIERNQPHATFWIEGAEREEVYLRLAAVVGVEDG